MFPDPHSAVQAILRWFHILAGIVWLGHLFFLILVNMPFQAELDGDLKVRVNPGLLLRVLFFFRWAAFWTWIFGLLLFGDMYMGKGRLLFDADGGVSSRGLWMLLGGLLGSVMAFNVWFVIWPRQKRLIHALMGGPAAPPETAKQAALASRVNLFLAGPMLWGMIGASHAALWPFTAATVVLVIVISTGLAHGLLARARKLRPEI